MKLTPENHLLLKRLAASRTYQRIHDGDYLAAMIRGGLIERDSSGCVRITELGWFAAYGKADPWPGYPNEIRKAA